MSGRDIPFDPEALCEECGVKGAYDFMGDVLCIHCASPITDGEDIKCTIPPEGWWCSREKGHPGPCAAREVGG